MAPHTYAGLWLYERLPNLVQVAQVNETVIVFERVRPHVPTPRIHGEETANRSHKLHASKRGLSMGNRVWCKERSEGNDRQRDSDNGQYDLSE
jgi:hypothetical protein